MQTAIVNIQDLPLLSFTSGEREKVLELLWLGVLASQGILAEEIVYVESYKDDTIGIVDNTSTVQSFTGFKITYK